METQNPSQKPPKRLIELDALRGIACISVMLFHYTYYYHKNWAHNQSPLILFEQGSYGVDLFFLISGFVIFMSLKNKNIKDFGKLRFWRLFPTYWLAIIIIFPISGIIPLSPEQPVHAHLSIWEFLVNFTMIPTIFSLRYVDSSHWTLGFELLFYLYISIIFWIGKSKDKTILLLLLSLTILSVIWHVAIEDIYGIQAWMTVWWREDMSYWQYAVSKLFILPYLHTFLMGISFYFIYKNKEEVQGLAIFSLLFGILADYIIFSEKHAFYLIINSLIFSTTIFLKPNFLKASILLYLGRISYSLYLIHQNIGFRIIQTTESWGVNSNIAIMLTGLLVIFLAHFLHFYVESPVYNRMRKRITET